MTQTCLNSDIWAFFSVFFSLFSNDVGSQPNPGPIQYSKKCFTLKSSNGYDVTKQARFNVNYIVSGWNYDI